MGCYDPCSWTGCNSYCGYGCYGGYAFDCCSPNGCHGGCCGGGCYGGGCCGGCASSCSGGGCCGGGCCGSCGPRLWNCGRWP